MLLVKFMLLGRSSRNNNNSNLKMENLKEIKSIIYRNDLH